MPFLTTHTPVPFNQQRAEELRTQMMYHVKKMQASQDSIIHFSCTRLYSAFSHIFSPGLLTAITVTTFSVLPAMFQSIDDLLAPPICKNYSFSAPPSKIAAQMFSPPSDICVDFSTIIAQIFADPTLESKAFLCVIKGFLVLLATVLAKKTYDWVKNEYMMRINCHPVTDPATFIAGDTQLLTHFAALPVELQLHIIGYLDPLSMLAMNHALKETLLQPEERQALDKKMFIQFVARLRSIKQGHSKSEELRTLYDQAWQLLNRESVYRDQPQLILRFLHFLSQEIRIPSTLFSKIDIKSLRTVFDKLLLSSTVNPRDENLSDPSPLFLAYKLISDTFPEFQAEQAYLELQHYKTFLRQYIGALRSDEEIEDIAQYT